MPAQRPNPVPRRREQGDAWIVQTPEPRQVLRRRLTGFGESGTMEQALKQALQVFEVVWHEDLFEGFQTQSGGRTGVIGASGRFYPADLVVGADGARSKVREQAQIAHDFYAYGDSGIVTHLNAELAHQQIARQWFTGDSILALLPLPDTSQGPQVSMVWSVKQDFADELMARPDDERAQQQN